MASGTNQEAAEKAIAQAEFSNRRQRVMDSIQAILERNRMDMKIGLQYLPDEKGVLRVWAHMEFVDATPIITASSSEIIH